MKKIGIVGSFGLGENLADGQNVKSNNIYKALLTRYSKDDIAIVDTHSHSKKLIKIFFQSFYVALTCKNIIIMPAQNGVKIFVPFFTGLNYLMPRSLHYVVVGGWLGEYLSKRPKLAKKLKKFDGIYPETNTLLKELINLGLDNCFVLPNFKELQIATHKNLQYSANCPYRICTFSRVMKDKGITDIIEATKTVNRELGKKTFELDIYGKIDANYEQEFNKLLLDVGDCVQYKGVVSSENSVSIIEQYFVLVFPTRFETEGIPGTIIDAYASGVPVVSARWNSFRDIIDENQTGFGFELGNVSDLVSVLKRIASDPQSVESLKGNCLAKAETYTPQNAIKVLADRLL